MACPNATFSSLKDILGFTQRVYLIVMYIVYAYYIYTTYILYIYIHYIYNICTIHPHYIYKRQIYYKYTLYILFTQNIYIVYIHIYSINIMYNILYIIYYMIMRGTARRTLGSTGYWRKKQVFWRKQQEQDRKPGNGKCPERGDTETKTTQRINQQGFYRTLKKTIY